jgi:predicted RNase H-like HicB family nuclease
MRVRVVIEFDSEVKSYAAYCPELPGCTSCGDTEKEALRNFKEALKLYFEPNPIKLSKDARVYEVGLK